MTGKKIIAGFSCGVLILAAAGCVFFAEKEKVAQPEQKTVQKEESPLSHSAKAVSPVVKPKIIAVKSDLYSSTPYDMPLISVIEISKLSEPAKKSVNEIFEKAQGFYFLKLDKTGNKVFAILQNPVDEANTYGRHELEFAEIFPDGKFIIHKKGYAGADGEIASSVSPGSDEWVFDNSIEPPRPLKHVVFGDNGEIKYTETWSYNSEDPVKYEMKDGAGMPVSIMKESPDGETGYRKEHIFYDSDGKTKMSVSASYDGANISRFTYYNSEAPEENVSIISEYNDGIKTGEKVYNGNYELINTVKADIENGERKDIKLYDTSGSEIDRISS